LCLSRNGSHGSGCLPSTTDESRLRPGMPRSFSCELARALAVMLLELDAELREFAHQLDRLDESPCSAVVTGERELLPPR
jgi:hypothetical protein